MKAKFLPFALLPLLLLLSPAVLAGDYAIQMARPLKAGDQLKLSVTANVSQSTTQTVNDGAPQEQKREIAVQFTGAEKVIEVDAKGKETKVSLTVEKFTQSTGDAATDVVPAGTVITCGAADGKPDFEIDGKAVESAVAQALSMVVDLSHGQHTDDEIFGTMERKKKGDSWDMNVAFALADLESAAGGASFSDLTGKTTLDDVTGGNMKISAKFTGKLKPPLPPSLTVDDSSFTAVFSGVFPVDVTKYQSEETQKMSMSFSAHADIPSGGKVLIKSEVAQSVTRDTTPF